MKFPNVIEQWLMNISRCFLRLVVFFALALVALTHGNANAQGFLKAEGKRIVDSDGENFILRGMGLGGWMLQEGYMLKTAGFASAQYQIREKIEELIGKAEMDLFYDAWLSNHVRKADIDSLKSWGFNSVRLPMHYNLFTLPIEEEPVPGEQTWLEKGFVLTDSLISWCRQNEMYVVLDLHAAPGGQGYDQGISDYNPDKPSLWESFENQQKTVALWKRLAERYADQPWVAGYDLINEPNWDMENNSQLRFLYGQITEAIRTVDTNHIIFIEGNWFANDFTGLTPPWDGNMVYSPHKYWSYNDQGSIQWVLNLREQYNVPLYLGESGENSNVWFRDAIALLEEYNIGWAWWPMKKIDDIAGPLSVTRTPEYQTLLNYWEYGGNRPSADFAQNALMELANLLKIENCRFQKDVIDAMFRQVDARDAIPYRTQDIPGVVYATDFDMGYPGIAYRDKDTATYHVSTGNFTAWNQGWSYRNDGVDIEKSQDLVNSNGYNVGWTEPGEWMQYDINVTESGVYDVHVRAAGGDFGGAFYFTAGGSELGRRAYVPNTGGYQNWETVVLPDLVLTPGDRKIRFHIEGAGANYGSFEFVKTGETTSIPAKYVSAVTTGYSRVQLNLNKKMEENLPAGAGGFRVLVNGADVPVLSVYRNGFNTRTLSIDVDHVFAATEVIKITYAGSLVNAVDGTTLEPFNIKPVENTVAFLTSTKEVPGMHKIHLYPNPVSDRVCILQDDGMDEISSLSVYDSSGQHKMVFKGLDPSGSDPCIDLSPLSGGVYIIHLMTTGGEIFSTQTIKLE